MSAAQPSAVIEEVIAVVGDHIVLKSDLEKEYFQMSLQYPDYQGDLKCDLFQQLLTQKLLLHKAELDSIVIADERLEYEITRRIEFYASQVGGVDRLEDYLGVSVIEYKDQMRQKVKNQMLVQEAQASLLRDLKVSPTEVRKFYNEIPADSIPYFNAQVEVGQIVIKPKPSTVADEYARDLAEKLRADLISGKRKFCITASLYSDDPGSKSRCGELGEFKRGSMVAEFERAAFKLKKDSISPVVKSEFGYHIIQLIERKGNILNARHILIRPKIVSSDYQVTIDQLKDIVRKIKADSMTFCDAAQKYSEDEMTRVNCGILSDPNSGTNLVEITQMDPDIALRLEKLKPGDFTEPHSVPQLDGSVEFRVLYLKHEVPPHKADLTADYQMIANFALEKKKQDTLDKWAEKFRKQLYIKIDDKFAGCPEVAQWQ
ncbi:MAG: peptidylprolyl isomerase [Flavobacteriales bacterium]|nr:peptidylprolyl isomerase [Flavobacteriales bacterium]